MFSAHRIIEAVVLIADRRESFERLGELLVLSPATPTMLINHPQLPQTVVRCCMELGGRFRLGKCECLESPQVEFVSRCQTQRANNPHAGRSPSSTFVTELVTGFVLESFGQIHAANVERAESMFDQRKLPDTLRL